MSSERFIEILKQRKLLSDTFLEKLREKLAEAERPLPATVLARFLVQKKQLSHEQALELIDSMSDEDVAQFEKGSLTGQDIEILSRATSQEPVAGSENEEDDTDFDDETSIFEPLFKGKKKETAEDASPGGIEQVKPVPVDKAKSRRRKPLPKAGLLQPAPTQSLTEPKPQSGASRDKPSVAKSNLATGTRTSTSRGSDSADVARDAGAAKGVAGWSEKDSQRFETGGRRKNRPKRKNEWDSPLILAGGGMLALLVLCAMLVAWMLKWESGDELLQSARLARDEGSYTQSISQYDRFLERFPRHSEYSAARVEVVLVRLRQATESGNFPLALDVARNELPTIEDEEEFSVAHRELTALLPRIARGLADQAENSGAPASAESVELADAALTLCGNTKYIPMSLRDEAELSNVQRVLDRIARRQQSDRDLQTAIAAMEKAIADGDTRAAYDIRTNLVREHPQLQSDPQLAAMVGKTSAAEMAGVRFVAEEQPPETTEPPVPWTAAVAMAHRRQIGTTEAQGTACVRADGAVYALDVATGKLLWRKYVGFADAAPPLLNGQEVYIVDTANHSLICLEARTGRLRWRQVIGEPFAEPLVVGGRMYLAAESGRLYVVDAQSGLRTGYLQFAQPLHVPPAADRSGKRLYLTGNHSSVYSISLDDLTCLGVYYLGHAAGSIRVPPVRVLNKVAVLEDDGLATSRLHLLSLDDQEAIAGSVTTRRLAGLAATAPLGIGRRLTVITDRGQIEVFDVGRGDDNGVLTPVASRDATSQQPLVRHVMLAGGHFWIGDTQLTKYGVQPTNNRLPVESIDDNFAGSTFDHPFQLFDTTLVHVRRPADRAGVAATAVDTETGRTLWETDLAVPPAWSPLVDPSSRAMTVANANGYVFRLGREQIRTGVQDEALEVRDPPARPPALTAGVDLGEGRAAFTAGADSDEVLLYAPSRQRAPLLWVEFPSPLACRVSPFGEGLLAPLRIGQVFYLDPASGQPLATAFQPRLQPGTTVEYRPAAAVGSEGRQFVIADGREKIYLVALVDRPQPHLTTVTEAMVGSFPIVSPLVVVDETVCGVTDGNQLVRFRLPSLEAVGGTDLQEQVLWGPYRMGRQVVLITADDRMMAVSMDGDVAWNVPLEIAAASDLAGPPLVTDDAIYLAYRQGILERRLPADGQSSAQLDVHHPLATGPVRFEQRVVLTAHDGTLLVVDQP